MSWSIQQVARMSGITARTLRYYDEIGLLPPDRVGPNGYRYYARPQMLRLQEVLLLRDLGLDLATIRAVIDAEHNPIEALRRHHRRLTAERDRLDRLATTVAVTIEHLEKGTDMPAENLFSATASTSSANSIAPESPNWPRCSGTRLTGPPKTSSRSMTKAFSSNAACWPCCATGSMHMTKLRSR